MEELRSEKHLLLVPLEYTEEDAADKFPKDVAAIEQNLKQFEEQEQGFDPMQLYEARQAIRPGKEQEAENRAQQIYCETYSPLMIFDSQKAVFRMLNENIERQAVQRMVRQS